jgi:hypothetical protein
MPHGETGYWQQSSVGMGKDLQRLAESFLGFVVFVSLPFVKFVGTLADHVGTYRHAWAAVLACPIFGGFEQTRARTEAALVFGDDKSIQFRACTDLDKVGNTDVRPADDPCVRGFRDEQRVLRCRLQSAHSFRDLRGGRRISKLAAKLGHPTHVTTSRAASYETLLLSFLSHLSACFLAQPFLNRFAF